MFKNMHEKIGLIAKEDTERAEELGREAPSVLRIILKSGFELPLCSLTDGVNSFDDETIDLSLVGSEIPIQHQPGWTVQTSEIAAIEQRFPYIKD